MLFYVIIVNINNILLICFKLSNILYSTFTLTIFKLLPPFYVRLNSNYYNIKQKEIGQNMNYFKGFFSPKKKKYKLFKLYDKTKETAKNIMNLRTKTSF